MSSTRAVLRPSTNAVQLTVPIGDDGQLMSGDWPVLWLCTYYAVQLTVPVGDDGQLMSGAWTVLRLSTNAVRFVLRLRRALFRSSFGFLCYALHTFPFLFCSSFPLFNTSRQLLDGGVFRSIGNSLTEVSDL